MENLFQKKAIISLFAKERNWTEEYYNIVQKNLAGVNLEWLNLLKRELISMSTLREQMFLKLLIDDLKSLEEIGKLFDWSEQDVHEIESSIIKKIKERKTKSIDILLYLVLPKNGFLLDVSLYDFVDFVNDMGGKTIKNLIINTSIQISPKNNLNFKKK